MFLQIKSFVDTLSGREVSGLEEKLAQITQALNDAADDLNLQALEEGRENWHISAFNEDGTSNFSLDDLEEYNEVKSSLEEARDSRREATMKALKIGAGVAVGATLTGLIWREANHRGWTDRAKLVLEKRRIARRFGKLAAQALQLWAEEEIHSVMFITEGAAPMTQTVQKVEVSFGRNNRVATGFTVDDDIFIPFSDIVNIEINRITDATGTTEAACLVVKQN